MRPRVLRPMEGCSGSILGENEICMHQPLIELGIHSLITAKSLDTYLKKAHMQLHIYPPITTYGKLLSQICT